MQKYPFIFSNEWKYRFQRHFYFWLFWTVFQGFLYSFAASFSFYLYLFRLPMAMLESFLFIWAHIFLAYSLMYYVIPRYLLKQKYWDTAIWTFICFLATAFFSTVIGRFIVDPLRDHYMGEGAALYRRVTGGAIFLSLLAGLRGGLTIGGIAAAIKLMKYWYVKEQRNLQLQKENIESQLQLLKAQVHPHFLFNTLNNIYSTTQNTSPAASRMITELSDILRFILYECNAPLVPLSKEIKMVRDYINLEQIRYGNNIDIHLETPEETNGLYIAPLLLLPLVENCFKHGTSNMIDQPWVSLHLSLENEWMTMKLVNGKAKNSSNDKENKGIGLQNVRKRLELIYPDKHNFAITNDEEVFIVQLKLQLEYKTEKKLIRSTELQIAHA